MNDQQEIVPAQGAVEKVEPTYRRFAGLVMAIFGAVTKHDWRGVEHVPREGGVMIVANHLCDIDPAVLGHFLIKGAGRYPRFLGKAEIWSWPVLGWLARACGQIKVERNSSRARDVVGAASAAIEAGKCVAIYPEGGTTRDPDFWPMSPRTGAVRIALATGCTVIPAAQWGPQELMSLQSKRLRLFPRKTMSVIAGPPLDLSKYQGKEITAELLDEAAEYIMAEVTGLLVQLRGGTPPAERYVWTPRGSSAEREKKN
ncbi:MAG: lysophospholipid acyltransferase family protein [Propionibacteriaceae bacterium]